MKAAGSAAAKDSTNCVLLGLYHRPEVKVALQALATDATDMLTCGLCQLGCKYQVLKVLDLSAGVAVVAPGDLAALSTAFPHLQGHAVLTQLAVPVCIATLLQALFPKADSIMPSLELLCLMLVKVKPPHVSSCFLSSSASQPACLLLLTLNCIGVLHDA